MQFIKGYGLSILFFVGALIIFAIRSQPTHKHTEIPLFKKMNSETRINPEAFDLLVLESRKPYFQGTLNHLIVFVDPEKDCPGYLFEASDWVAVNEHLDESLYKVSLFIPETSDPELREAFRSYLGITKSQVFDIKTNSALLGYRGRGLYKVLYNLEKGIIWEGSGEDPFKSAQSLLN